MAILTQSETELHLLREPNRLEDWKRWRAAAIVSAAIHVVVILLLLLIPEGEVNPPDEPRVVRHVTTLYIPTEFTQKAPNKGKIQKELTAGAIAPRPLIKSPSPAPAARQAPPPVAAAAPPPKPVPAEMPKIAEPPKIAAAIPAPVQIAQAKPQPPPLPPPNAQPKLSLQDVLPAAAAPRGPAAGKPTLALPNSSVQEAIHNLARQGLQSGQTVGDIGSDEGGSGLGLNLPPSAGRPRSQLELKSDPMGVDFRPYLLQVLAAVRRNWFAVYPEAARLGQRGQVVLQFAIENQGTVAKIIFSPASGSKALDQAAVAAISASNPLPPLPTEFRGARVVLQMTFQYNMPR